MCEELGDMIDDRERSEKDHAEQLNKSHRNFEALSLPNDDNASL
jgi:hypothetical protein